MCVSRCLLLLLLSHASPALRVLSGSELRCPRQDVVCSAQQSHCLDPGSLKVSEYTPSGPESLQVWVDSQPDEEGRLQPVLRAQWILRDDGSIRFLKATELQVLVFSTNQNLCVRYSFRDRLPPRAPSTKDKWNFSVDMLVVDPGLTYKVSVFNIPRPELNHTWYDVSREVTVPDCDDPTVRLTQFCIQRGSLWRPNITVDVVDRGSSLAVSFLTDPHCEDYMIVVTCSDQQVAFVSKDNRTALKATFSLDLWPRRCCRFRVEVKPRFPECGEDCPRVSRTADVCEGEPPDPSDVRPFWMAVQGGVFLCVAVAAAVCVFCRKSGSPGVGSGESPAPPPPPPQPTGTPTVLIIYSQDHRLYRDVVLKLCAFLQARCGTRVLVDLLDSASVGVVGRLRWLERQRQQLRDPSDKILVLCSRGVQAKWRAMCGQGRVTLREDVLSPTDDMLTPFLNLFLPSMHHAGMLGQYLVAYFEDISGEQDVPSVFDIAVKYRLMKHLEELCFRILDLEKFQPGRVNRIRGVGADEYRGCASGRALHLAIQAFRAHQLQHPDWFEKECVHGEDELLGDGAPDGPSVLERVPLIRDGPPACRQEVQVGTTAESVRVAAPELRRPACSVAQVAVLHPGGHPPATPAPPALLQGLTHPLGVQGSGGEPVYVTEPVLNGPGLLRRDRFCLSDQVSGSIPADQEEEAPLSGPAQTWLGSQAAPQSPGLSRTGPPPDSGCPQPVEVENRVLDQTVRGSSSGSDQGYSSRTSSQPEAPPKEDPLLALARLQEELFEHSLRS